MGRSQSPLRIWIDLANSPHPLLFAPVARLLEAKGHQVLVTVRDNAQTAELAGAYWPSGALIGGESPANPAAKAAALMLRAFQLARWARSRHLHLAVSHNSYAQILAARMVGVPVLTAADFEHQPANHLAFRLAKRILMPEAMQRTNVEQKGASPTKSVFYPGLKEELYIGDFEPDTEILGKLEIERTSDQVVVVTRPPPSRAIYHRFPNPLFVEILQALDRRPDIRLIVLARHAEQREAIRGLDLHHVLIPSSVIDSRSLMYAADLVIGAGGTMNREAALLGIPTVTVYRGSQPAVDRWLEQQGLLRVIRNAADIGDPAPRTTEPRTLDELRHRGTELSEIFVSTIETTAQTSRRTRAGLRRRAVADRPYSAP